MGVLLDGTYQGERRAVGSRPIMMPRGRAREGRGLRARVKRKGFTAGTYHHAALARARGRAAQCSSLRGDDETESLT